MKLALFAAVGASLICAGAAQAHPNRAHYNAASGARAGAYYNQATAQAAPLVQGHSRAQTWYSDTGWQPGTSAISAYGYGYGYGGTGQTQPVIVQAPYQGHAVYGPSSVQVQRSQPFGYVVDGYGRYPWSQSQGYTYAYAPSAPPAGYQGQYQGQYQGHCNCAPAPVYAPAPQPVYYQAPPVHVSQPPIYVQGPPVYVEPAQVVVTPSPVHVAAPQVEVAAPQITYEQGYFAVPIDSPPPAPPSPTERPYHQEPGERG